jgi:hypothetical protein
MSFLIASFKKHRTIFIVTLIVLVVLSLYGVLHTKYQLYDVDDVWRGSLFYSVVELGKTSNMVFSWEYPPAEEKMNAKMQSLIFGHIGKLFNWTKSSLYWVSVAFLFLAAFTWHRICRRLVLNNFITWSTTVGVLVMPAFFRMAHSARPETMILFLIFLAFWLYLKEWYLLVGLALAAAIETHFIGFIGGIYIGAHLLFSWKRLWKDKRRLFSMIGQLFLGALIGLGYILIVSPDTISGTFLSRIATIRQAAPDASVPYFIKYFFLRDYLERLPELLLMIFSFYIFIRKKYYKEYKFFAILVVFLVVSSFIIGKGNRRYMVFFFPMVSVIAAIVFEKMCKQRVLIGLVSAYLLIIYSAAFFRHHDYDLDKISTRIQKAVADKNIPIVGMGENWFAVPHRKFIGIHDEIYDVREIDLDECYYIRNDYLKGTIASYYDQVGTHFSNKYTLKNIDTFKAYRGGSIQIFQCKKKAQHAAAL